MKRFYKQAVTASSDGGFTILLDGRGVKTPRGARLVLPTEALAAAIAAEWNRQGETVDPAAMPLTRFANTVIDGIAPDPAAVVTAILRFGENDLLCYRAYEPPALAERQRAAWDPLLDWAAQRHGARLAAGEGLAHLAQPNAALTALRAVLAAHDPFTLAGLHVIASITGSLVLALAVADRHLAAEAAFAASRIDEAYQIEKWGSDAEAALRAENLAREMAHAAALMDAVR